MGSPALRCRQITSDDLANVIDLLTTGFKDQRGRSYWERAVGKLAQHPAPAGYPKYGYMLERDGEPVGVILQIFTRLEGWPGVRCNMSSWWVVPEYRVWGSLLIARSLRHDATYTNITPAPHTLDILTAQGYQPYCRGRVIAAPWLLPGRSERAKVLPFSKAITPGQGLSDDDVTVLRDHVRYGCICLVCEAGGVRYPFVFAPRRRAGIVGLAIQTYCSASAPFRRFSFALGQALLLRGLPLVVLDADGPIAGLRGRYFGNKPKYFQGPHRPRIDDHAYSERALFGS